MSTTLSTSPLRPPLVGPFADGTTGRPTLAWLDYFQQIADQLQTLNDHLTDALAGLRRGVTDGSDAAAGDIGEYMTATGGTVTLATSTTANLVSLDLTAGDWDVSGTALFSAGSGTHVQFAAGIGGLDAVLQATFPGTAISESLPTAVHRVNVTATTTVWLVANAVFTGTVNASGTIRARRVR